MLITVLIRLSAFILDFIIGITFFQNIAAKINWDQPRVPCCIVILTPCEAVLAAGTHRHQQHIWETVGKHKQTVSGEKAL